MHTVQKKSLPLRRKVLFAATALAFAVPATGALAAGSSWFGGDEVKGSGVAKTQTRNVGQFTGVDLSLPANTEVRIGATEGVTIEADDNLLPMIETVVERGMLKIRPTRDNLHLRSRSMKIVVTAKSIDRLELEVWWASGDRRRTFTLDAYRPRIITPADLAASAPQ